MTCFFFCVFIDKFPTFFCVELSKCVNIIQCMFEKSTRQILVWYAVRMENYGNFFKLRR
jgi:hypothetical protein